MPQIVHLQKSEEVLGLVDSFKRITKHSFVYGLGSIAGNVLSFLLIPLYTRFLTTGDYGILSSMYALDSVLMILLALALQGAVFRFYFDEPGTKRKEMIGSIWLFQSLIALAASILLYVFSGDLAKLIFKDLQMQPYLKLVVISVFFNITALMPLSLFRAEEKSLKYTTFVLLTAILGASINIYFVVILKKGALGSLQGGVITAFILYISYLFVLSKEATFVLRWDIIRKGLLFSLPLVPHLLSGWIINLSDRILLQRLASAQELGLYSLGCNFSLALGIVVLAFNNAWAPFFFSIAEKNNGPGIISRLLTYYFLFICFIALALSLFSKEITTIMAAPNYKDAYKVIPVLALGYILQGMYFIFANCIFFKKETKYLPFITSLCAAINFCLNILWIPRYGMMGAAWATAIAFGALYLITYSISRRMYIINFEKVRMAKIVISVLVIYTISFAIKTPSLVSSISFKALSLLGYILLLFVFGFFSPAEINNFKALFRLNKQV